MPWHSKQNNTCNHIIHRPTCLDVAAMVTWLQLVSHRHHIPLPLQSYCHDNLIMIVIKTTEVVLSTAKNSQTIYTTKSAMCSKQASIHVRIMFATALNYIFNKSYSLYWQSAH